MTRLCGKGLHDVTLPGALTPNGRCRLCKRASKLRYATSPKGRATSRRWEAAHPEKVAAYNRRYYEANADAIREKARVRMDAYYGTAAGVLSAIRAGAKARGSR